MIIFSVHVCKWRELCTNQCSFSFQLMNNSVSKEKELFIFFSIWYYIFYSCISITVNSTQFEGKWYERGLIINILYIYKKFPVIRAFVAKQIVIMVFQQCCTSFSYFYTIIYWSETINQKVNQSTMSTYIWVNWIMWT